MTLRQVDTLVSVPLFVGSEDLYYWTETYYVDDSTYTGSPPRPFYIFSDDQNLHSEDVQLWGYQEHASPGGSIIDTFMWPFQPRFGDLPVGSPHSYTLLSIARWKVITEGRTTYKYHRLPLRAIDVDGEDLTTEGWNRSQGAANNMVARGAYRNKYGDLWTSVEVDRRLHMWQLRHGTRRRNDPPFSVV